MAEFDPDDLVVPGSEDELELINMDGLYLQFVSESTRNNRYVVALAVQQCGLALRFASPELCDDANIVLTAVTQYGFALEYASARLRDFHAIVLAAITQNGSSLNAASVRLRDSDAIVRAAVTQSGIAIKYASPRLRLDVNIVCTAIANLVIEWNYFDNISVRNFIEFVDRAFKEHGYINAEVWLSDMISRRERFFEFMLASRYLTIGQIGCASVAFNRAVASYVGIPMGLTKLTLHDARAKYIALTDRVE